MFTSAIMGVKGLWQLLESVGRPVTLESLENKVLGVGILKVCHITTPDPLSRLNNLFV